MLKKINEQLRKIQIQKLVVAYQIVSEYGMVYLDYEMRCGKTWSSLKLAEMLNTENALYVTVKKPIAGIREQYDDNNFKFPITITNFESLFKPIKWKEIEEQTGVDRATLKRRRKNKIRPIFNFEPVYDTVIVDEAHFIGAYPKASHRLIALYKLCQKAKHIIYLSGTPTPESYSQIYHQFNISPFTPFKNYVNFYEWAKDFVDIEQVHTANGVIRNSYKHGNEEKIRTIIDKYFVKLTQVEAGFKQAEIHETVISVPIDPNVHKLIKRILKEKYYIFKDGQELVCDTGAKLQQKVHQLFSGTIKLADESRKILDISKASYIQEHYNGLKLAIFYQFIAEGDVLKSMFKGNWTDDPKIFAESGKHFISQNYSSMGYSLMSADILISYNISFSAMHYWQMRARIQDIGREIPAVVHWLFAENGIEHKIYERVLEKKDYTLDYFRKDYNVRKYDTKIDDRFLESKRLLRA